MRPRLINQARLNGLRHVVPAAAAGCGWVVTEPALETVSLLDHDLQLLRRIPVPLAGSRIDVTAADRFIAAGDGNEIAVLDETGKISWRSGWDRFTDVAPVDVPGLHLDAGGVLWVRLADAQQLLALDAASGDEIHRVPLAGPDAALFLHRPTDPRTGLTLLHPDPSPGALISLVDGHIALRPVLGYDLAGFSPAGSHYLTMGPDGSLSVRDLATESVLVRRHLNDLPDLPADLAGSAFADWATFLTDELILVSLTHPDAPADVEGHLLLSARSLRCRSTVRYQGAARPGSIIGVEQPGRWLTHDHESSTLRLWQVDDRLDDEPLPGQLSLL